MSSLKARIARLSRAINPAEFLEGMSTALYAAALKAMDKSQWRRYYAATARDDRTELGRIMIEAVGRLPRGAKADELDEDEESRLYRFLTDEELHAAHDAFAREDDEGAGRLIRAALGRVDPAGSEARAGWYRATGDHQPCST